MFEVFVEIPGWGCISQLFDADDLDIEKAEAMLEAAAVAKISVDIFKTEDVNASLDDKESVAKTWKEWRKGEEVWLWDLDREIWIAEEQEEDEDDDD